MRAQYDAFDGRLVDYLRQRFPAEFGHANDDAVRSAVAEARRIGRRYGIVRLDNVGSIADLIVMYGPDFDQKPWAHDILSSDRLHGPDKMALLRARLRSFGVAL